MNAQFALLLIFAPVVIDTFATTIRRTLAGHHPFTPHFDFYYQRMYLQGYTTEQIVMLHWIAMLEWGILGSLLA